MNEIPDSDIEANSNEPLAIALETASRLNGMAGMGDKMTSVHVGRLTDAINVAFSNNQAKGVDVMVGLIRGSGLLESETAVAKATVTDMLQTSPDVLAGVISSHQTPQAMATALNNLSKTVAEAAEPPSRVYSVIGDLSPRIPDGQARGLFWQQMFTAADQNPDVSFILRDGTGALEIQGVTQLFQRMAPEPRDGLVAHLDTHHPLEPSNLPAEGGRSWGTELHGRLNDLGIGVDVRSLRPTGDLDSTTQLLMAAENPNLPADALLQPMLHIAKNAEISNAVLPTLMSSAKGALALRNLTAISPELAEALATRLTEGEIKGSSAQMLRSIPAVKSAVIHQLDPSDQSSFANSSDLGATTRWVEAINAKPHAALIMAENSPDLIPHLTTNNLALFVDSHSADIERFASKVANNPHFIAQATTALKSDDDTPEAYRSRVLMRAVTELETARDVIKGAVTPNGANVKEVIERTIGDPQFLAGPDRAGAIKTLVSALIELPAPAGRAAVDELARVTGGSAAPKDLTIVVGKVLIDEGRGDALSGMSLLNTMKSNGFVPSVVSIEMAHKMTDFKPMLVDFAHQFPDLGDQLRERWPVSVGAPAVPAELGADRVPPDQGLQTMLQSGVLDQHSVDMMAFNLTGNPAAIGSTLAEVEKQVRAVVNGVPQPSIAKILETPVFKVLGAPTNTGASVWDRLIGGVGMPPDLGARAVVFMTQTRAQLGDQFVDEVEGGLGDRAATMKSLWALCPGQVIPASETRRWISALLETVGKTGNVPQAASELMGALAPLVLDDIGHTMVTETLKAFMGKSDMQAAAGFAGLSDNKDLASAALDALKVLHPNGPQAGTALEGAVSRFVRTEITEGTWGAATNGTTGKLHALFGEIVRTTSVQPWVHEILSSVDDATCDALIASIVQTPDVTGANAALSGLLDGGSDENRIRLASSVMKAMPQETEKMTQRWDAQPLFQWCPELKTGLQQSREDHAVDMARWMVSGGSLEPLLTPRLGMLDRSKVASLDLDVGVTELMTQVDRHGITPATLRFATVPGEMHASAPKFDVPRKIIESSLRAADPADTPKKRAALGMLLATALAEGGTDDRDLVTDHSNVMASVGLSVARLGEAQTQMQHLVNSNSDGNHILRTLSKEGFSLTEILVMSRVVTGSHQTLLSVGVEKWVDAALVGADVRSRETGADMALIKQQLMTDMMMLGTQADNSLSHPDFNALIGVLNDPKTAGPSGVKTKFDALGRAITPEVAAAVISNGMDITDILGSLARSSAPDVGFSGHIPPGGI